MNIYRLGSETVKFWVKPPSFPGDVGRGEVDDVNTYVHELSYTLKDTAVWNKATLPVNVVRWELFFLIRKQFIPFFALIFIKVVFDTPK